MKSLVPIEVIEKKVSSFFGTIRQLISVEKT